MRRGEFACFITHVIFLPEYYLGIVYSLPMTASLPRYSPTLLRAGPLRLDGGSMFGVVPRVVWSRQIPADDKGRILVAHNCLLLTRADNSAGPKHVLIESGSGNKFNAKNREIFGLSDHSIESALAAESVPAEAIDHVILSHLHFDHAGGLTRLARESEAPDYIAADASMLASPNIKLNFPNAHITVQKREWADALVNRSVMTRTYLLENLHPLREHLNFVTSPDPFPIGHRPLRDESPPSPITDRMTEVLPGIHVFLVPGHTWGQQAILFHDPQGRPIVFTPDILPTTHHVGAAYNMAYDVEPYISTVTRRWFLQAAADHNWLLVLDHEPDHPCQRVEPDGKGWFKLIAGEQ